MRQPTEREQQLFARLEQWWLYQYLSSVFAIIGYGVTFALLLAMLTKEPIAWNDFPTVIVLVFGGIVIGYAVRAMRE